MITRKTWLATALLAAAGAIGMFAQTQPTCPRPDCPNQGQSCPRNGECPRNGDCPNKEDCPNGGVCPRDGSGRRGPGNGGGMGQRGGNGPTQRPAGGGK